MVSVHRQPKGLYYKFNQMILSLSIKNLDRTQRCADHRGRWRSPPSASIILLEWPEATEPACPKLRTPGAIIMHDNPIRRSGWRYPRLTVRVFIVLVLLVGAWLGWTVRTASIQRDAITAIEKAGGRLFYSWEWKNGKLIPFGKPKWPNWLVRRLGVDYFGHVAIVSLAGMGNSRDFEYCLVKGKAGGGVSVTGLGKNWGYVTLDPVQRLIEDPGGDSVVREEVMKHLGGAN